LRERERESKALLNFVKSFFSFLLLTLSFFIFSNSVSAATYYVAGDTGLDTNDGSISTPWKTIQKAADTMVAGDTVNVKGGITYIGSNFCVNTNAVFCPANSGTSGSPITYQSWVGTGTPILDGQNTTYGIQTNKSYLNISGFYIKNLSSLGYGINISGGAEDIVANNIIESTGLFTYAIYFQYNSGTNKAYNNIVYLGNSGLGFYFRKNAGAPTALAYNNIVIGTGLGAIIGDNGITCTSDYNLIYGPSSQYSGTCSAGVHDVSTDPQFVDSSNGNYHIKPSSPAKNTGITLSDVTLDILGVARPQGSSYDIGAYEYYNILVTLTTTPTTPSSNTTPTIAGTASTIGTATVSSVTYSVDSGSWSSTGVTGTDSFTIVVPTVSDDSHTVRVRATDSYGNVSDSTLYGSTTFTVDTTAPTSNSVAINSGATYSTSRSVTTLTLSSTGASQMMISEDSGFSEASWETYSTSKSFDLSSTDGTKTVYAKFKDESGNTSSSVSDSIVLDTVAPSLGSFITPRDYTKDDNKPTLTFKKATDSTSGISSYSVSLDSGKNKNYSTSGIPATGDTTKSSYLYKDDSNAKIEYFNESDSDTTNDEIRVYFKGLNASELTEGKHSFKVTVTDKAGNENSSTQDFYLDKTPPGISELAIANISTVKKGQTYTLSIFKRIPSFSGKIEDPFYGSEKTNDDGSKDTFDKVSSGIDNINLTLKKLDGKKYVNHFTKDYSVTSNRFYITTPYPLVDGQYEVLITAKDKAGNNSSYPAFYLKIGNNSFLSLASSFVSNLFNNGKDIKQINQPTFLPSSKTTVNILNSVKQQRISTVQSFVSWVANFISKLWRNTLRLN